MLVHRPKPQSIGPQRHGVEQLGPAGAGARPDPQLLQRLTSGSALIKLEQTGALRRCPPARWQPLTQQPAGLRAKRMCSLAARFAVGSPSPPISTSPEDISPAFRFVGVD